MILGMKQKQAKALLEKGKTVRQVGALALRTINSRVQVLLVSSRQTKRVIIPKGWPMPGKPDWRVAEIEAHEEAGIVGSAGRKPIGSYRSWKRMKSAFIPVRVDVYLIADAKDAADWKETHERQRGWVDWDAARLLIEEPELITLLERVVGSVVFNDD